MNRYFAHIAFEGTQYHGWQIQPDAVSVQETIEKALSTILRTPTSIVGCGRTDTGVHASSYWIHFDIEQEQDPQHLTFKMNSLLPSDIAFYEVFSVPTDMHARFTARWRTYHYFIHDRKEPFLLSNSYLFKKKLDLEAMNLAGKLLEEVKDFSSFCKSGSDQENNLCNLRLAKWEQVGEHQIRFTVTANRFLRNMVRALVGTFIEVGLGKISPEEFIQITEAKSRSKAGVSVPAQGLFLAEVEYENHKEYLS